MKRGLLFYALTLNFISLVSAAWGGWYNPTPSDIFNSDWMRFIVVFLIFYGLIFFTMIKVFKESGRSTAVAVSMGVSLLITAAAAQQGLLEGYVAEDLSALLLILGFFVLFGFAFRFVYKHASPIVAYFMLVCLWFALFVAEPEQLLPYVLQTDAVIAIYEFIASFLGLLILIAIGAIASLKGKKPHLYAHP